MKIPSLKVLLETSRITFYRFILVILISITGSAVMSYIIGQHFYIHDNFQPLYNIVMVCTIGIPFMLSLSFISERIKCSRLIYRILQIFGLIILFLYYLSLSREANYIDIARFLTFIIVTHLLLSLSPFIIKKPTGEINGFWQFNQILFIRILLTAVYSGALYVGLSVAILSFNVLFNAHIDSKIYAQLFFLILGSFNTWFFLSDMPENLEELDSKNIYYKGLKIFTQFVLIPLVIIYLLILYLYMGKIIIEWKLPVGWVSYLVLGFSATGIFSLLLIHPLRNLEGNNWIKIFSKIFYYVLYPLIVLLFIAIIKRTDEYGITERRYYVFVLACWLAGITLYFTFSKLKNIKTIPISLCIIAFLTSLGPWSAFSVSQNNQVSRLSEILKRNEILVNDKIQKAKNEVSEEDRKNVSSILKFLEDRKALAVIQPWFDMKLDSIKGQLNNQNLFLTTPEQIMNIMGVEYFPPWKVQENNFISYYLKEFKSLDIKDYSYYLKYIYNEYDTTHGVTSYNLDSNKIDIIYNNNNQTVSVLKNDNEILSLRIKDLIKNLKNSNSKEPGLKDMSMDVENESGKAKFVFKVLNGNKNEEGLYIKHITMDVLLKMK